jgi:outer membrane protein OmpA-like peptidoglycan-associated protein
MKLSMWCCAVFCLLAIAPMLHAQEARINMGPGINSAYSELQPVITSDNQILFFTRKGHPDNVGFATRPDDEDIWYATRKADGTWSDAVHLAGPLNTPGYDGVRAVNNATTHLYLQNQYRADGTRGKGFSVSERAADGSWGYPTPLNIENYSNDTTVATLGVSQDENVLVLSLKRRDSKGGHDLYVSFRTGAYSFSEPKLIDELSTTGDEIAPFIGYDNGTIYFPSTGFGADSGAHDIFVTRRTDSTWMHWTKPEKLPSPINTPSADFYFDLSASSDTAYVASWHETTSRGYGKSDIWKIAMPQRFRPGTFIPGGEGPALAGGNTPMPKGDGPPSGSLLRLENLFFDTDKSSVRRDSKEPLEKLLNMMRAYPNMRIEIQGHTDSDGSEDHNIALSAERATTVMKYLIENGIAPGRLQAKGYGKAQPIAPNTTSAGKQLNRRVMVQILGYDFNG